ncbi:MAG: LruC domain-containing protein [Bacteroidales bacterium]|nr:LruC domain-containing protein [Bacteroidales bacterium]
MKKINVSLWVLLVIVGLSSCTKELDKEPVDPTDPNVSLLDLEIPATFNFETSKEINMSFEGFKSSADGKVKYNIYLHNPQGKSITTSTTGDDIGAPVEQSGLLVDAMSDLAFTQITSATNFDLNLTIPSYYDSILVVKNDMADYSTSLLPLNTNKLTLRLDSQNPLKRASNANAEAVDIFYGVNSLRELFKIDSETGEMEVVSTIPDKNGSYTCAVDPVKEIVYTVGISSPYYLYAYDIANDKWSTKGRVGYFGPRMGYNINDGLLYYSFDYWVLKLDPNRGRMLSYYKVNGFDELDGGDLTFDDEGTMFISTTSGLYRCEYASNNSITATRISAENLPNYPNSLTYDSDQNLWWASNVTPKGRVYIMDDVTGGWENRFGDYTHYIHDLATLPLDETLVKDTDSDGDGIIDFYDEYPNDNERAYNVYTPSIYGIGTYAFEDLWPNLGDFDFNDMVINYHYTHVYNSAGLIKETIMDFKIKNVGGSFRNGFGIEINADATIVKQVSGYDLTTSLVSLNSKGLENNQTKPVIFVFDDAWASSAVNDGKIKVLIEYDQPVANNQIGALNPFIFIDGNRGRELHLVDMEPTDLMDTNLFRTADDDSNPAIGRYYRNATNLPWGINILYDFTYPKEKIAINKGYTMFSSWAVSGGSQFTDWYKDQSDYRNNAYLVVD